MNGEFSQTTDALLEHVVDIIERRSRPDQLTDLFHRVHLQYIIAICHRCRRLSEAVREWFTAPRCQQNSTNLADRLANNSAAFGFA